MGESKRSAKEIKLLKEGNAKWCSLLDKEETVIFELAEMLTKEQPTGAMIVHSRVLRRGNAA